MSRPCVVLGGGGHAKSVIEALRSGRAFRPAAVTDLRAGAGPVLGVRVAGGEEAIPSLRRRGIRHFLVGLGGVPDNRPRAALFRKGLEAGLLPATALHGDATVADSARIGGGSVVLAQAVVNADAVLGVNALVNSGAVVEHDAVVGDHAHVGPGAILCGGVTLGEGAFVGAGAVVREGVRVGAWAVVGAGAVVLRDVPARARVAGVPARPV